MKAISLFVVFPLCSYSVVLPSPQMAEKSLLKNAPCHGPKGAGTPMGPAIKEMNMSLKVTLMIYVRSFLKAVPDHIKYPKISIDMPKMQMPDSDVSALISFMQGDLQK